MEMKNKIDDVIRKFNEKFGDATFNEILGCAKTSIESLMLIKDVDDYNFNEIGCEVDYEGVRFEVLLVEGVVKIIPRVSAWQKWVIASEKAITLWNTPHEEVKVEITNKAIKFFRRDDMLTCYEYPPLHKLKNDNRFLAEITDCLMESCQYNKDEFVTWVNGTCDMPPFPISAIFHSDYTGYKFHDFDEE